MQFKVPQFLDIEDKIFGPFTFRQFAYLAGGAGLAYVFYKLLGLILGAIPILVIAGFAVLLTFYRPNNKPFINMVEAGFKYFTQNKLYIWKKKMEISKREAKKKEEVNEPALGLSRERLSSGRLKDLAWSLDVLDLSKKQENSGVIK